jgi:hypothetical protein
VLLRCPRKGSIENPFEFAIHLMCKQLVIPVELRVPEAGGRDQVFHRDIEMVAKSDLVICVFSEADPMGGGTGHVVEKAIDRGVPVYAYTSSDAEPQLWTRLGEWDAGDAWSHRVPVG